MPRSLNEPVGLSPSTLSQTSQPVSPDSQSERTSGVPPSPRVTAGDAVGDLEQVAVLLDDPAPLVRVGRACSFRLALDAHHRGHLAHDVHPAQAADGRRQLGVGRRVGDDDELGVVAAALLADGLDRHAVVGERVATAASTPARSSTSIATW